MWAELSAGDVPTNLSALAALIGFLAWFARRADKADERADTELAAARDEIARLHAELEVSAAARHDAMNRESAALMRWHLAWELAKAHGCTELVAWFDQQELERRRML